MEKLKCCCNFLKSSKPYIAMISLQFGYAGMNIITKVSLNRGMSHYVLVVYRHAFATAAIAPFALIFERRSQPKITFPVFMQIFIMALLGPVIDQNFYYAGLKYTSPTFACALSNVLPAMTFLMAIICRMEKVDVKKVRCQAKIIGTLVTVAGAMVMTLYKGPIVELFWGKNIHPKQSDHVTSNVGNSDKDWVKGSIFLIIGTFAWSSLFVLQAKALKTYKNHQLSLTSLVCFVGTLQAIAVTFVMEHKTSVWQIGWDMNLLAAAYSGIVASGISYYVQGLVMKKRGPVFATAFNPLIMIIVAIMGSFILAEKIFLGGVIGAILIVVGLYSVLWGKHKENKEKEVEEGEIPEPIKVSQANGIGNTILKIEDLEANGVELQNTEENNKISSIVIAMPMPESPKKPNQEKKIIFN